MPQLLLILTAILELLPSVLTAPASSSCSVTLTASYPAPSVRSDFQANLIANKLQRPRSILFDSEGHLLVVQAGHGITSLTLKDSGGGCMSVSQTKDIIKDSTLNHGIELSQDGKTLYASNSGSVYSWDYDAKNQKNTSGPRTLVTGMANSDHTTRTLLLSKKVKGRLLVSRGSNSNVDVLAEDITTGHSQIRSFDVGLLGARGSKAVYQYNTDGVLIGWGLRNSVGVAEHPATGGLYSVENSVDEMRREGVDIHQNNPGEELNFHGYLNGTKYAGQGQNYGYPNCFAVWNATEIPNNSKLKTGMQIAIQGATVNDTICQTQRIAPKLTFPAHWAPLDIKFNAQGNTAWITSHGSWDRDAPDGYLLFAVTFSPSTGMPNRPSDSTKAIWPIMRNVDNSKCPNGCFRPVGLAFDTKGNLFMTSDSTGEIYVIRRASGASVLSASVESATED